MAILSGVDRADFNFMLSTLGLSKGNLACHVDKLEQAGYVEVQESFIGKIPHTEYRLTDAGRSALADYWAALDVIRASPQKKCS
jgi:DNA-binding MarR family transcriptional regulator